MGTKHKHYDVIVAWAAGEEVEYWNDSFGEWREDARPPWHQYVKYRIKPKTVKKEGWVNVYGDGILGWRAYPTEKEADANTEVLGRIACVHIEWEEEK